LESGYQSLDHDMEVSYIHKQTKVKYLRSFQRKKSLEEQFEPNHPSVTSNMRNSLDRIYTYVIECTNVQNIVFVQGNILMGYIAYQCHQGFKNISFSQTIKDIKHFIYFMENVKNIECNKIDYSLQNINFWINL
jgi:hypothetical protein